MSNLPGLYCQKSLLSVCFTVSLCTQAMFVFVPYAHPTNHPACSVMALLFSKSGAYPANYLFCVRGPYGRSFDAFHVVAGKHPHSAVFRRSFHPIVLHVNHVIELFPCLQFQFVVVFRFKIKQGLGHWQTHRQHRFVVFHRFHVLVHVLFELGLGGHRIGFDFVKRIKTTTGTCRCWCCFVRWTTDTCRCWCCFVGWTTPSWRYKERRKKNKSVSFGGGAQRTVKQQLSNSNSILLHHSNNTPVCVLTWGRGRFLWRHVLRQGTSVALSGRCCASFCCF